MFRKHNASADRGGIVSRLGFCSYPCRMANEMFGFPVVRILLALFAGAVLTRCTPEQPVPLNPSVAYFDSIVRYPTEPKPTAVTLLDWDNDSKQDLVAADGINQRVGITFQDHATAPIGTLSATLEGIPRVVVAADLYGTGRKDLVVAAARPDRVVVYPNPAARVWPEPAVYPLPENCNVFAALASDFTEDQATDIACACNARAEVVVFINDGAGGLLRSDNALSTGLPVWDLTAADFDKDGHTDVASIQRPESTSGDGTVRVYYGDGRGGFPRFSEISVGPFPRNIAAGDFDADGWTDLAVSRPRDKSIVVLQNAQGVFATAQTVLLAFLPTRLVAGDFNGDGRADLAALLYMPETSSAESVPAGLAAVCISTGGTKGFAEPRYYTVAYQAYDMVGADFNADGRLDLLSTATPSAQLAVALGRPNGTFRSAEHVLVGDEPRMVNAADFNQDGRLDLAVNSLTSKTVTILAGDGAGHFTAAETLQLSDVPRALAVGDVNQDGKPDVLVTLLYTGALSVFPGVGNFRFQPEIQVSLRPAGENRALEPRSLALGDLNKDGKVDLVVGAAGIDALVVLLGEGDGRFSSPVPYFVGNFPLDVHLADLNRDGNLDAVTANSGNPNAPSGAPPRVNTLFGKGDGTFDETSRQAYSTGPAPRALCVADVNRNGWLDVVTTHENDNQVYVLYGRQGGKLTAGEPVNAGLSPNAVFAADISGEGLPDLIVTSSTGAVNVLFNRGNGAFTLVGPYAITGKTVYAAIGDFNGDRILDAATVSDTTRDLAVLLGNPTGKAFPFFWLQY